MARKRNQVQAVGYVRTSSAANIGGGKDSEPRQRRAIERFAKAEGFDVVEWFNDPAVSGADPIESRPGFAALLNRIDGNGVRVVLVEDASRFARDLMAQELGLGVLIKLGMKVLTANGDDLTVTDDHMKVAMRQIAGTFAQLEKARLVAKLKAARDRKKAETGKCGGRKSYAAGSRCSRRATSRRRHVISQDQRHARGTRSRYEPRQAARRLRHSKDAHA